MNSSAILARLAPIFQAELDDASLKIDLATTQEDIAGWDSLAHVRIVAAVEQEFDIQLEIEEIESINSINAFIAGVSKHLA